MSMQTKEKEGKEGELKMHTKLWFGKLPQFRIKPYERSKSQARVQSTYTRAITQLTAKRRSIRPTRVSSQFSIHEFSFSPTRHLRLPKTAAKVSEPITIIVAVPASPRGRMNTCSMHTHKIICVVLLEMKCQHLRRE